jgi:hypothetical protein
MKNKIIQTIFIFALLFYSCQTRTDLTIPDPGSYDGTWWNRAPVRLVQTNFPEVYAGMSVDEYVKSITDASASALLFNTGGITASYQTQLPFQYKNPHMGDRDFIGELIKKLHDNEIKYIARFDFSKVHQSIADKKPEWLYVGANGKNLEFNTTVAACINGGYYQEYAFEILREVINNYDIDGIFFNMMGYTGPSYAGTFYGICQCENCKRRYYEKTGYKLPIDNNDPHIDEYRKFQRETSNELYRKITDFIKQQNPDLVIYNYNDVGTSWIASESGASMRRGVDNIYHATINVKRVLGTYKDKSPVNLIMGFQAIGYRNIMSSPNLLRNWFLEDMLHGAPIGFVVVGTLVHYEDRKFIPVVNELFGFHKKHEKLFTNIQAVNNVALLQGSGPEFQGMVKLLSEEHIMYDIINPDYLGSESIPRKIGEYDAIIIGNIPLKPETAELLDNYVSQGGKLLVTGSPSGLNSLGVAGDNVLFPAAQATYLKVSESDKEAFAEADFEHFTLMMMNSDFLRCSIKEGATGYFRLLPTNMYGPSEKTYYNEDQITGFPGAISFNHGKGSTVFIPWMLGSEYDAKGNYAHRAVFLGSLNNLLKIEKQVITNASPMIEITHLSNLNGSYEWLGMINHSGFMGTSVREPVTIYGTTIKFKPQKPVKEIRLLRSGLTANFSQSGGWIECSVPEVRDFEMLLCLYK